MKKKTSNPLKRTVAAVYELQRENLSNVGGRMGTEHTWVEWRKLFSSAKAAKMSAETTDGTKIKWTRNGREHHSPDLSSHMYHIRYLQVHS